MTRIPVYGHPVPLMSPTPGTVRVNLGLEISVSRVRLHRGRVIYLHTALKYGLSLPFSLSRNVEESR
jgi:hypothetical protein